MKRWFRVPTLRIKRTDKVLVLCGSFLAGLLLARLHLVLPGWFVILLGVLALTGVKKSVFHFILLALFGLSLGLWRGTVYLRALQPYQDFARQQVTLRAKVSQDAVYGVSGQLSFEVKRVQFVSPMVVSAPGTIKISGFGEFAVYRGDVVEVSGKLYPTRGGKQSTMSYTNIQRIASEQTWADNFRRSFVAGMQTALPEPAASFGSGLLIGQRSTLPFAISQAFLMVGLTHIIAVSGYNLTILLNASKRLLEKRSKQLMVLVALLLVGFFMLVTGASASIVRAAVVSGLALAAWYYGRPVRPMVLIVLAAALTAYATPVYIWSDIGWWLSMLAFFGILVVAPTVLHRLFPKKQPPLLASMAVETLAAEAMTIPLVMFIFGQVSLVGLLANMLVALFIPIAMLLSFIAGLAGMLVPLAAGWAALPAQLLLTYMLDVTVLLSQIPRVFRTHTYLSVVDMTLCYALIITVIYLLRKKKRIWFTELATTRH
jgi:ComEC/Rec2-related protein